MLPLMMSHLNLYWPSCIHYDMQEVGELPQSEVASKKLLLEKREEITQKYKSHTLGCLKRKKTFFHKTTGFSAGPS